MEAPLTRKAWLGDWAWFCGWAIASSIWCLLAAAAVGNTYDEQPDLDDALDFWRTGSHFKVLRLGAMPLPLDLASLPIHLHEVCTGKQINFRRGDQSELLFQARAMLLIFWWLLLFYARRVGRSLGGPWAGRLAVAFLACEPNFLAHASLATKDIAVSACLLAFAFHFAQGREAGWWKRIGVPSIWLGLALLSKASALTFAPICMLAIEIYHRRLLVHFRSFVRDGAYIGLLGLVITFVYCGSDWQPQASWVEWAHSLPEGTSKDTMVWLAENTKVFSNAGVALARQITHNLRGHGVYILGETDPGALWYYFPLALSIKLTLPLLFLPIALLIQPNALRNWACLAAALLLLYSLNCRVQIGVRLMLPVVVLAVVGLAAAAVQAWQESSALWKKRLVTGFCTAGLLWTTAVAVHVWPHGLCYTNELWGGTAQGYHRLSDSNYDWGQGVPELERWRRRHQPVTLAVWYFGSDSRLRILPIQRVGRDVTSLPADQFVEQMRGKHLAVSTTLLYGAYTDQQRAVVEYLRGLQPCDRTQTFLLFDFTKDPQVTQR